MEVEIVPPSAAQMRKLKMGQPFRAKLGPGLKVNVPMKEAKKLQKAAMKGSGVTLHGCSVGSTMLMMGNPYSLGGRGNVKATAKDSAKRLMVAGTDRAVRALEGSGMVDSLITRAVMDGNGMRDAARASAAMNMGGAVNRRKKFNKWFKDIGQKFKPLAKNVKPIKQALTARAVDLIENYNNPQAQAQSIIDMAQKEFKDTAGLVSPNKKRAQSYGSASVRDDVAPADLRRGTFISPMAEPQAPPQPVDVNDDGEPDGYFYPNEASWFGAGMPKGKRGLQGVRKALRHAGAGAPPTSAQARAMLRGSGMREVPPSLRPQPISGGMAGRPTIIPVVRPQPARGSGAKKTSPWIEHVKAYCAKHGCKYGEGLKLAKASYKTGGALYPAGYDPRYDR